MDITSLLDELRPLLVHAESKFPDVVRVLSKHKQLVEYEVARVFVERALGGELQRMVDHEDARVRVAVLSAVPLILTRASSAQVTRRLVKDPNRNVRRKARRLMQQMAFTDVALPDSRFAVPAVAASKSATFPGAWNPTGWLFGTKLFRTQKKKVSKMKVDNLPSLASPAALLKWLAIENRASLMRLMRPGEGVGSPYVSFEIAKATGGSRKITAPRSTLKKVQRQILRDILDKVPVHEACHGFVKGRSVLTNAQPHTKANIVVKIDLKDFFPTIHFQRVLGLFMLLGYKADVAKVLAGLCTHRAKLSDGTVAWPGVLPQGAPTSPAIANILCRRLDARLSALAKKLKGTYTRYADDLTFSFEEEPSQGLGRFMWWVEQICQQEGFAENTKKRRILRSSNQQRVTGIVVNSGMFIPREERKKFRAIVHNCQKHGLESQARGRKDFRSYLLGYASYIKMVQPDVGVELLKEVKALIKEQPKKKEPEEKTS